MGVVKLDPFYRQRFPTPETGHPEVLEIVCACAEEWEVSLALVLGPRRAQPAALARQVAMYLAVELRPDLSYPTIARLLDRDHTTIIHAARRIAWMARTDEVFAARLRRLRECMGGAG